ncbi:MAG: hypothetical protein JW874_00630, partial [Spirochaetales bacterium]|nr:hypothetical protein [Spirochaetales bacterium]
IFPAIVQVSLGIRVDPAWKLAELPYSTNLPLEKPIVIDRRKRSRLGICHYMHDPAMAPAGATVILVRYDSDYDWWKVLKA